MEERNETFIVMVTLIIVCIQLIEQRSIHVIKTILKHIFLHHSTFAFRLTEYRIKKADLTRFAR